MIYTILDTLILFYMSEKSYKFQEILQYLDKKPQ